MRSWILITLCLTVICAQQRSMQSMQNPSSMPQQQQAGGQDGQGCSTCQPGYLPDYQGDKYTNQTRIQETQALNKKFFDTIGGPPSPPPQTPAQQGMGGTSGQGQIGYNPSNTQPQQSQQMRSPMRARRFVK
ncbi:unnamed protein product, partial [Mesorhabditis belari]|uniref:Uncharacterized protein n=1 Tax=Mesorhabditis belari TaxID=2138241 RepID=A0AAF3F6J4_9BILA